MEEVEVLDGPSIQIISKDFKKLQMGIAGYVKECCLCDTKSNMYLCSYYMVAEKHKTKIIYVCEEHKFIIKNVATKKETDNDFTRIGHTVIY